jgi:hypothetical protein
MSRPPKSDLEMSKEPSWRDSGVRIALLKGIELVENAFAHVSHGGPTRADAEAWLKEAREAIGESPDKSGERSGK